MITCSPPLSVLPALQVLIPLCGIDLAARFLEVESGTTMPLDGSTVRTPFEARGEQLMPFSSET